MIISYSSRLSPDQKERARFKKQRQRLLCVLKAELASVKARYTGPELVWEEKVMPLWRDHQNRYKDSPYGDNQAKAAVYMACRLVLNQSNEVDMSNPMDHRDPVAREIMCRRVWQHKNYNYDPRCYPSKWLLFKIAFQDRKRRRECAKSL